MLDHNLVLKSDELYLTGDISTDGSGERATGLYLRDTRHLSHLSVTLNGNPLERLSARVHNARHASVTLTNGPLEFGDTPSVPPHTLSVEEQIVIDSALRVTLTVQNYGAVSMPIVLALNLAADFRDLFDIRGMPRPARGRCLRPRAVDDGVVLAYRGLDSAVVETEIRFNQPHSLNLLLADPIVGGTLAPLPLGYDDGAWDPTAEELPGVQISFDVIVAPKATWQVQMLVVPRPAGVVPSSVTTVSSNRADDQVFSIETDDPSFNAFLHRSLADLDALQTTFPEGSMPAAGIPWFVAPFGRDSLIVGLQTLHLARERAKGTLQVLAALQGSTDDPARGEQPGKILHEKRYGEMARLGEVPHTPYYGSVDATPLFVLLFAETTSWTADHALYRGLLPNVQRAVEWIERYGDLDGDGLIEYRTDSQGVGHIRHQVWKDSWDSLHHADGRAAEGAVAAIEVQGYAFAAFRRLADVAEHFGDGAWAAQLRARAESLRRLVEDRFWVADDGYYAQALDGNKEPVRAISSNAGHLLFCGLPTPQRAAAIATRMSMPEMSSGWGIRTLSADAASYNPMSYHNGSVWPHDNSLIAAGLAAHGLADDANQIASALYSVATSDPQRRLPELYCGFPRQGANDGAPVAYPVSCSPQAWAAGAGPLLVRSMLGLSTDLAGDRLRVSPSLPDWLEYVTIHDMPALGRAISLTVRRVGSDYQIGASEPVERGHPIFVTPPTS